MPFFYNIFIHLYCGLTWLYGLFNHKARLRAKAQYGMNETIPNLKHPVWFHAASVGEFEQALPLYDELKKRHPNEKFVFSFFSPSGYQYARKKFPELTIFYLPADTKKGMYNLLAAIQPKMVIIIKYEFWFHLMNELNQRQIPVYLVSGIFRKTQIFFKPLFGIFFRKILQGFTHLFVQDENSRQLLNAMGIDQVSVTGDTRYDRVRQNKNLPLEDQVLSNFIQSELVCVMGSVWKQDKEVVRSMLNVMPTTYQIIIAPHELKEAEFWCKVFPKDSVLYSTNPNQPSRIIILDTIGLLSRCYRLAKFAYVGGGFGKGIHNVLEAAVYHIPVIFGPKYQKFREAVELSELELAFAVDSPEAAAAQVSSLLNNDNRLTEIAQKMEEYFHNHSNISTRVAVLIEELNNGRT